MKKDAKIIAFATQKGGSGKTTLLMLTAAALHNRTDKKILVIDADLQQSVKQIFKDENNPKSYDVFAFNWLQPKAEVNFDKILKIAKSKYDIILIDVPGKLKGKEIYYSLMYSDALIVPVVASTLDINATTRFLESLPQIKEEQGSTLEVFGVINKKDQSIENRHLRKLSGVADMEMFYSPISNLVRYKRSISTWKEIVDSNDTEDEFNRYFDEFCTKCYIL